MGGRRPCPAPPPGAPLRPLFILLCLAALPLRAGILRDIQTQAEQPRPTETPAPQPTDTPTQTPPPWSGFGPSPTPEVAESDGSAWVELVLKAAYVCTLIPIGGPIALGHDDYKHHDPVFPYPHPVQPFQVQVASGAGWLNTVKDGNAELRLAVKRVELEMDFLQMQEKIADGGKDQFNQYTALGLFRYANSATWRGRVGFGVGLLSPLNGPNVRYGGLAFGYEVENQHGAWIIRLREELAFLASLIETSSRLTLGFQMGPLELYGGGAYRDYSGIGFGGLVVGAKGTF